MSNVDLVLNVLGAALLALCGLVGGLNWYLSQPIALLRYGRKGLKQRASPAVLIGDLLFFLGTICLFGAQRTQSGRDVALLIATPVWLINPVAIPWLLVICWIAVISQLINRPPDGALSGLSFGGWIGVLIPLLSFTGLFVWMAIFFYRELSAHGFF